MEKDQFGPEYVVKISDSKIGLEGFLVVDNTTLGPGKGGIRMTANVNEEEVFRLARTMTWKNALAELPFGGAKAGIIWKGGSDELKKTLIQHFAQAIKIFTPKKYIAGPDVNTGEKEMAWFVEATGDWRSATGKPANLCMKMTKTWKERCGIPHETGSTGFGVAQATAVAAEFADINIKNSTVAIHGFGNVGTFTFQFLAELGAKVVALADLSATIYEKNGFDKKIIEKLIEEKKQLRDYLSGKKIKPEEFWRLPVDILIPASVTDVINETNKEKIKAKIIIEAANIPMNENIEEELFKKGILIVPDLVANAGGVISSYAEYRGYHPKQMFEIVKKKITKNTELILKNSRKRRISPQRVALEIAQRRIIKAMKTKGNL